FKIEGVEYGLVALNFENAIILFVYEGNPKFGTCGLSVPGNMILPANTVFLSGSKNDIAVRTIGERLAKIVNKLALVSINVTTMSNTLHAKLWEFIETKILSNE
ncbi:MAG: hypothetical protein ACTSYN_01840, partial [Candidatus Heimdallarchaeaceae archaeon]